MREIAVAAAQMAPVARGDSRADVVERLLLLLHTAVERGAALVVFPELALTTFFPRYDIDGAELESFYETEMPSVDTKPLFEEAARLHVGFAPGPEGFGVHDAFGGRVGMAICNDRRWPETYRVMGLQGVELVLIGYNTPIQYVPDPNQDRLAGFHNHLVMASGAYQNGTWVVGVGKGGVEEGVD